MTKKEVKTEKTKTIDSLPKEIEELVVEVLKTEEEIIKEERTDSQKQSISSWVPKTNLGKLVKSGKIKSIDEVLEKHKKILEPEIVDYLLHLDSDLLLIGQAKGKFGGGKRRAWRQTQKKTMEGNVISFSTMVVVGDKNGHVGLGYGKAKETLPAREKALRQAKLNIIKIIRGFEDPADSAKSDPHTVPFKTEGKCGSVRITLLPAPRGTGLSVADECKKILKLAGIQDVYSRTKGQTRTTFNLARACIDALSKINRMAK